jgi:hypothetical protein
MPEAPFEAICATFKRAAAALRDGEVRFMLGGGLAAWARGGPTTQNDLDLIVAAADAERALAVLEQAGMRTERPPEEWLLKAYDGDVLIDVIFAPKGLPMTDDVIARGEEMAVLSMEMRVMALEDMLVTKLMALSEHALRYESLLRISRALREQVDWATVRARTETSPFARAFFVLAEGLAILPATAPRAAGAEPRTRVRVLTPPGSGARGEG